MNKMIMCTILITGLISSTLAGAACNADISTTKPDNIYIDHTDGTVSDIESGLMWQKCSSGMTLTGTDCSNSATTYTWEAALIAAQTANTNNDYGYSDWRLPNTKELASLTEAACANPAINSLLFPGTPSSSYWSSSPNLTYDSDAYLVRFGYGEIATDFKNSLYAVRLVRDNR